MGALVRIGYATRFDTVELNNSFYRQPTREQFERWRRAVPVGFAYAVKLCRFIAHIKRLNADADVVASSYDIDTKRRPTRLAVTADFVDVLAYFNTDVRA